MESAGFSPKVLQFFRSVPIVSNEMACLDEGAGIACYGTGVPDRENRVERDLTTWDHDKLRWINSDRVDLALEGCVEDLPFLLSGNFAAVLLQNKLLLTDAANPESPCRLGQKD